MKREPLFNIPTVVAVLLGVFSFVHFVRSFFLTSAQDNKLLWLFAFNPIRYAFEVLPPEILPGGLGADIWTFVTYAFLHGSWIHFGINAIWFLPFGSAVARRFGTLRFLLFFAATSATGALAHLFAYGGENAPVIGASAAISGTMAAAMRFAFQRGGPLKLRHADDAAYHVTAVPLFRLLREPALLVFLAVWLGINLLFGTIFPVTGVGEGEVVAWQAHIGGFLGGLLLFSLFDPVR